MQSLLSLDGTVVVQIANFAGFLALLNVVYLRPAGKALAARRAHINAILADYEQARHEAKLLRDAGEAQRLAVHRECEELLSHARTVATAEAETIVSHAASLAQERSTAAHATVAAELIIAEQREVQLVDELAELLLRRVMEAPQ